MARLHALAIAALLLAAVACTSLSPSAAATINIVDLADLAGATRLELYERLDAGMIFRTGSSDASVVDALVAGLDASVELIDRARCPDQYVLYVLGVDGLGAAFGLVCGDSLEVIRGAQPWWANRDARIPPAARSVLDDLLAGSTAPPSLPSDAVAFDAVAATVAAQAILAPYVPGPWRRQQLQPDPGDATALERWLYTDSDWVVELVRRRTGASGESWMIALGVPAAGFTTTLVAPVE